MRVRWRRLLVATVFLSTLRGAAQTKPDSSHTLPQFSLQLSPPDQEVKAGSAVKLEVKLLNVTDHAITYSLARTAGKGWTELTYQVKIQDAWGTAPPLTKSGRAITGKFLPGEDPNTIRFSYSFGSLNVGQSVSDVMTISNIYDLVPGSYRVTLRGGDTQGTTIFSNQVTITVTP